MLEAPPIDADWPLYAAGAIKGSFYVPDMSRDERQAWLASFIAALGDLPRPFVDEGFRRVLRRGGSMRPTPGDIYVEAKRLRDDALEALKTRRLPRRPIEPEPERGPVVSPEEAERVRGMLAQLGARLRSGRRALSSGKSGSGRIGTAVSGEGASAAVSAPLRRRTDAEIEAIIRANPARKGQTVEQFRKVEEEGP